MIRLTSTFRTLLVALVAASAACLPPSARAESIANPIAVFNGLDKITARITRFEVPIDRTALFGTIEVTPRVCHTKPPTEPPQTTAFVEVNERRHEGEPRRIFTGWMFADSPGLSGVEHPVYDVWLTGCKTASG
jgi:hypothetical protein